LTEAGKNVDFYAKDTVDLSQTDVFHLQFADRFAQVDVPKTRDNGSLSGARFVVTDDGNGLFEVTSR
jgi:hypothetical protein